MPDIHTALAARDAAEANYQEADPEQEAVAWHELQAARERVRLLLRDARQQFFLPSRDGRSWHHWLIPQNSTDRRFYS